jgi:hypothetical protein
MEIFGVQMSVLGSFSLTFLTKLQGHELFSMHANPFFSQGGACYVKDLRRSLEAVIDLGHGSVVVLKDLNPCQYPVPC